MLAVLVTVPGHCDGVTGQPPVCQSPYPCPTLSHWELMVFQHTWANMNPGSSERYPGCKAFQCSTESVYLQVKRISWGLWHFVWLCVTETTSYQSPSKCLLPESLAYPSSVCQNSTLLHNYLDACDLKQKIVSVDKNGEKLVHCWKECKMMQQLWISAWWFLKKLSIDLPCVRAFVLSCFSHVWFFVTLWTVTHQAPLSMGSSRQEYWSGLPFPSPIDLLFDPAIPPLNMYLKELKAGTQTDIYTSVFLAALFTIAKGWKQPMVHQWINAWTDCDGCTQWNITQPSKGRKFWHMLHVWTLKTC